MLVSSVVPGTFLVYIHMVPASHVFLLLYSYIHFPCTILYLLSYVTTFLPTNLSTHFPLYPPLFQSISLSIDFPLTHLSYYPPTSLTIHLLFYSPPSYPSRFLPPPFLPTTLSTTSFPSPYPPPFLPNSLSTHLPLYPPPSLHTSLPTYLPFYSLPFLPTSFLYSPSYHLPSSSPPHLLPTHFPLLPLPLYPPPSTHLPLPTSPSTHLPLYPPPSLPTSPSTHLPSTHLPLYLPPSLPTSLSTHLPLYPPPMNHYHILYFLSSFLSVPYIDKPTYSTRRRTQSKTRPTANSVFLRDSTDTFIFCSETLSTTSSTSEASEPMSLDLSPRDVVPAVQFSAGNKIPTKKYKRTRTMSGSGSDSSYVTDSGDETGGSAFASPVNSPTSDELSLRWRTYSLSSLNKEERGNVPRVKEVKGAANMIPTTSGKNHSRKLFVAVKDFLPTQAGELSLTQGDMVEGKKIELGPASWL